MSSSRSTPVEQTIVRAFGLRQGPGQSGRHRPSGENGAVRHVRAVPFGDREPSAGPKCSDTRSAG